MMTPNDILNKRFDKGMGGYKMEDVHAFLIKVSDYLGALEQEKVELQRKLEVLAEELIKYKEEEESLLAAMLSVQKLGNDALREAQRKADKLMADTVHKAEEIAREAQRKVDEEAYELAKIKKEVASFKASLKRAYRTHLNLIEGLPGDEAAEEAPKLAYTSSAHEKECVAVAVGAGEDAGQTAMEAAVPEQPQESVMLEYDERIGQYVEPAPHKRSKRSLNVSGNLTDFFGEDKPVEREG